MENPEELVRDLEQSQNRIDDLMPGLNQDQQKELIQVLNQTRKKLAETRDKVSKNKIKPAELSKDLDVAIELLSTRDEEEIWEIRDDLLVLQGEITRE